MYTQWSRSRKVSLAVHLVFVLIPLGASTVAAFVWWSALFGNGWSAAGLIATLEVLAITSLILHIGRVQWPLTWFRHAIPFISMVPLGYELYKLLEPNGVVAAGALAVGVTGWFIFLSHRLFTSLEGLFIDPVTAARERTLEQMSHLQVMLTSWQVASQAVQGFAHEVYEPTAETVRELPSPPTSQPLLEASDEAHPKMQEIARLAQIRAADGSWALTPDVIQREARAPMETVSVLVRLVRSGQIAVIGGGNDVHP